MNQNIHLWLRPAGTAFITLVPGQQISLDFIQCLDGKFSYELWLPTPKTLPAQMQLTLNDQPLVQTLRLTHCVPAWQMVGAFQIPKGEHRVGLCNTGTTPITLTGLLATRDAGYVHSGLAATHLSKLLSGEPADKVLAELSMRPAENESPQEKLSRQKTLQQMGFLATEEQYAAEGNCPCGVPLGGIGAGKLELDKHGNFTAITINNNGDAPIYHSPSSFFALRTEINGQIDSHVLQTAGTIAEKLPHVQEIGYTGLFPRAALSFPNLPLAVTLNAFSALTPELTYKSDFSTQINDYPQSCKDSALPAAGFIFTLKNPSTQPVTASILFSFENLLGTGGTMVPPTTQGAGPRSIIYNTWNPAFVWCNRTGNHQIPFSGNAGSGLSFFSGKKQGEPSSYGNYTLLCPGDGETLSVKSGWNPETDLDNLWAEFTANGSLTDSAPMCSTPLAHLAGAVCCKITLAPGQQQEIPFVLAWYLPHFIDAKGKDIGVYYGNFFTSSHQVASYFAKERTRLYNETIGFEEQICSATLPQWLQHKLINDRFPIYTCSWFSKAGKFAINEAPTGMMGCLGTMDQRLACNSLYTNFFPWLDRVELGLFAAIQGADGSIPHDLGAACFEEAPVQGQWSDLCSSFILQVYKYYTYTGDKSFLSAMYPRIKRAVAWQQSIDFDQNGIPDVGAGHGTTYDTYHWYGTSAFVASLWLCQLKACMRLAQEQGDITFETLCQDLFAQAQAAMLQELWNDSHEYGAYFNNYLDTKEGRSSENCFIAQLAGQWFADLMDLGDLLPKQHITQTLETIYKRNLLHRGMALMNDETTPEGDFYSYGYTFVQYNLVYFGCLALGRGMVDQGLDCFSRVHNATKSTPWNIGLTYMTDGSFSGLPYYMTNPSSLFILEALSGFVPDAAHGVLRLAPKQDTLCLPLFSPKLCLWIDWEKTTKQATLSLKLTRYDTPFTTLRLGGCQKLATLMVNGKQSAFLHHGDTVEIPLSPHALSTNTTLSLTLIFA